MMPVQEMGISKGTVCCKNIVRGSNPSHFTKNVFGSLPSLPALTSIEQKTTRDIYSNKNLAMFQINLKNKIKMFVWS